MTPPATVTDDGWMRMRARLDAEAPASVSTTVARVIRMRWVIATAIAAAAVVALAVGLGRDVLAPASVEPAPTQASDTRPADVGDAARVVEPPKPPTSASTSTSTPVPAELPTIGAARAVPTPVVPSKPRTTPSVPATDAIALEAELVHRAEAAIAKGKLRAADAVLDTYARRFGAGQMAREVSMLRIVVACGDSDAAAVEAAVRRHAAAHPEDPALARLRAQPCASTGSP
jgi:hypothetical protein